MTLVILHMKHLELPREKHGRWKNKLLIKIYLYIIYIYICTVHLSLTSACLTLDEPENGVTEKLSK